MSAKSTCKYFVGIDLGTTHTAVAYVDKNADKNTPAELFEIEQLVGPGKVAKRPLLPSFRYHPSAGEIAPADALLPWSNHPDAALPNELSGVVIGEWARLLGGKSQGRLVSSAKSWLSHHKVDRNAAILPWGASDEVDKVSPVFASASYLKHICQAWNREFPDALLADQNVVITIPASFDEGARGLTVQAAKLAGLDTILLLEEPQAVCYDWYNRHQCNRHQKTALQQLKNIPLLMVCDVGGGTTDLSLISAAIKKDSRGDEKLELNRIGVGDHLMLGGDNIDLALAYLAEQQLNNTESGGDKKALSSAALAQLIQQTRIAKETLLADDAPETATITLLGSGSRLIGGAKHCQLTREQVRAIAVDGFFPIVDLSARPQQRRSALIEFGLPFVADAAVPKHLAEFIANHHSAINAVVGECDGHASVPAAVLLNGGVFNSALLKQRLLSQFSQWRGGSVTELENLQPNLAVAFGAVAYANARRGRGVKIGGGSARSFYLKLDSHENTEPQGICLLPKGCDEETDVKLSQHSFALTLGQPVSFNLCANSQDLSHQVGDSVDLGGEHFIDLPPLITALQSNTNSALQIQVNLIARLTEVGTLQIDCEAVDNSQRWSLEFSVRGSVQTVESSDSAVPKKLSEALALIDSAFSAQSKKTDIKMIKTLRPQLEKVLGDRSAWPANLLRPLCDQLLAEITRRRRTEVHEQNWLRLTGFSVRPGFGDAVDAWRIEQLWPLYREGLQYSKSTQAWGDWWTFWRRVSGGLNREQQQTIYADIAPYLDIANINKRQVVKEGQKKSYEDMVLLAASLESISEDDKVDLANWLLERCLTAKQYNNSAHWWAVGRVCSRSPFYGSDHNVLDAEDVEGLLEHLLGLDWKAEKYIAFAAVMMSRKCGDRSRDINDELRGQVVEKLRSVKVAESWVEMVSEVKQLDEADTKRIYGDGLPAGLQLLGGRD